LDEWIEAARRETRRAIIKKEKLGDRKNWNLSLQESKWRAALGLNDGVGKKGQQGKRSRDRATPMEIDYATTDNSEARPRRLSLEERKKLMEEGRCFRCRNKGHQARECKKFPNTDTRNSSNARTTKTSPKERVASSSNLEEAPPAYSDDQLAGMIRAMSTDQKENLLTKIASKDKGKKRQIVDDRDSDEEGSDEGF
jgi:hypothetical protein